MINALPAPASVAMCAAGSLALMIRPVGLVSVVTTGAVGVAGVLAARPSGSVRRLPAWLVVAVGMAGVLGARAMGPSVPVEATATGILALVIAGVAEEAFFRGAMYRVLEARAGAAVAIATGALVFAVIHVPGYGTGVLGIDLAAGALFGWQRWATGSWLVPALTHVSANLMQLG